MTSRSDPTRNLRIALGVLFIAAGVAHLVVPGTFGQMVPGYLADYRTLVNLVTGFLQIVGGITLLVPRLRLVARWTNLALLVPSLVPAIQEIFNHGGLEKVGIPPQLTPVRVLVQLLVIFLTWRATRPIPEVRQ